ncbi:hypothetical protein CsSME_00052152 [Camellia sinensis var. sinensis]
MEYDAKFFIGNALLQFWYHVRLKSLILVLGDNLVKAVKLKLFLWETKNFTSLVLLVQVLLLISIASTRG